MVGTIEQAVEKGKKLAAEAAARVKIDGLMPVLDAAIQEAWKYCWPAA
jgi:hypothetical protein